MGLYNLRYANIGQLIHNSINIGIIIFDRKTLLDDKAKAQKLISCAFQLEMRKTADFHSNLLAKLGIG